MSRPWHTYSAEALEAEFNTNLVDGLSSAEARSRYAKNKKNNKGYDFSLFVPDGTSFLRSVLEFARNPFAIVLLILSLLTALFGRLLLGLSVFAIAVTVTVIGGIMSGRSSEKLNAVRSYSSPMVRVRRSGNLLTSDGRNLVCGDIIVLGVGDLLPCDARVIESEGLTVDELSADGKRIERKRIAKYATVLCGEDCNADIAEAENMLFAGSAVMSGWAVALVTDIGRNVYLSDHLEGGDLSGKDRDPVGR